MKKEFNKLIRALFFAASMMCLTVSCDNNTRDTNEPEVPQEEGVFTVTGTDGISITYKKSDKLKVQQYYIYNSEYICIYNKYSNFSETFNYPYVDKGTTYSYRIFYKFNDEQKILDGKIAVEKGAGEFKTSDYASVTLEKGVLKISGIKIPEFSGATLNNVNISLNSGEGGWDKDYDWINTLYASEDEIKSGNWEINIYDTLSNRNLNPDDYDGKKLWITLGYSFKIDGQDYFIQLLEDGFFTFTFENTEKDVVKASCVPEDAYYVVLDANNLKVFPENMKGPDWQFSKALKHDEPYNKSIKFTPVNDNYSWSHFEVSFAEALDVNNKTLYVVLKGKAATDDEVYDSLNFNLGSDSTHINDCNLHPTDDTKYVVYSMPVSDFNTKWSEDNSIEAANLSAITNLEINFRNFTNPLWIEAIYLK